MRYVIGFLISIGLIILVFVMLFRGGGDTTTAPNAPKRLVDYANTTAIVRLTEDYPVSANQTHRQVVTTVGRDQTTLEVKTGYEGDILRSQQFDNNPTSYANFLRALHLAGFAQGSNEETLRDERGYCPTGRRYIYEIRQGSQIIQRYWSTSCGKGSFEGKAVTVRSLFKRQVPDYNKLTSGLQLF
jgi:hypothetical protein